MKKFKNVFLLAAMAVSAVFVGCDKENDPSNDDPSNPSGGLTGSSFDGVITATVSSGLAIDEVKVNGTDTDDGNGPFEVAKGKYENGGFTLKLPATIPAQYLHELAPEVPTGIISDANVKMLAVVHINAYINGKYVGDFVYGAKIDDDTEIRVFFIYADRNVTITGSYTTENEWVTEIVTYNNVTWKKGWNKVYFTSTQSQKNGG
ncbi:hypothetical protein AGMMS49982_08040 [Bacteroidia bacterium]|nr:hypothetical protein AGMMS49982_08040 [Bacteroidia bacterium]